MHLLTPQLSFPSPDKADRHGLLAVGGDLSPERLILAYRNGIFPWFDDNDPILWWSPPQRMVLFFDELKISKSMRNILNREMFRVTFNQDFAAVIASCRKICRKGKQGTWITKEIVAAYTKLHELGMAKSVEVWQGQNLVGGLYGVDLVHIFSGESMFSKVPNASKVAFIALSEYLSHHDYKLLDCQIYNDHLASLGAREIAREEYLSKLKSSLQ